VIKIEKRLKNWNHRFLSKAAQLVLIKFVLEATLVYWMSLAWIPREFLLVSRGYAADTSEMDKKKEKLFLGLAGKKLFYQKNGAVGD